MGLVFTRADMVYWTIRCSEEWFLPIYQKIHEQLLKSEVLHMVETRIQCIKKMEEKPVPILTCASCVVLLVKKFRQHTSTIPNPEASELQKA